MDRQPAVKCVGTAALGLVVGLLVACPAGLRASEAPAGAEAPPAAEAPAEQASSEGTTPAAEPKPPEPSSGDSAPPATEPEPPESRLEQLPPEVQRILRKLDEANQALKTVQAKVVYEREIPLLEEKEKARGTLLFQKPDHIVLKLGKPRNEDVCTNGKTWWVVSHNEKQVEVYEAATDGEKTGSEAAFLRFGYGGGAEELLKDYAVELTGTETPEDPEQQPVYALRFVPRERPDRAARYAAVEVLIEGERWLPHVLVLRESGGEIVHTYRLSDIRLDEELKEEDFEYEPPRGYTVLRP